MLFRRAGSLTGVDGHILNTRSFAGWWPAHTVADLVADLCCVEIKLGESAAQGVAVHAELLGGLALVAFVVSQNLEDIAPLELAHGIGVGDSCAMHLRYDCVHFALQDHLTHHPNGSLYVYCGLTQPA